MLKFILLQLLFMSQPKPQAQPILIYVGDPMCSWCYGFAPELNEVKEHYGDKLDMELVMGGLRPYNTQMMTELKDFLTHHWEDVNKASGQEFNYEILSSDRITYDTEPPSRAAVVVRKMDSEKEYDFFKKSQTAFYLYNQNMHLAESYDSILAELELDTKEFDTLFHSDEMKQLVRKDFERAGEMGVRGFPTLLLKHGDKLDLISNGYLSSEDIIQRIDKVLVK